MGIEIILYVCVVFFSAVLSIVWEKINLLKLNKNKHKIQFWIVFLIFSSLISIYVYTLKEAVHNANVEAVSYKVVSSQREAQKQQQVNTLIHTESIQNNIMITIQQYLNADHTKDIERIDTFFTFPMVKYYKLSNPTKKEVNNRIRYYWRHRISDYEFQLTQQNTEVSKDKNGYKVCIKMKEDGDSTIYLNIKLNSNYKIYYIGNSILTVAKEELQ